MNKQKENNNKLKADLYYEKILSEIALYIMENSDFEKQINFILERVSKSIGANRAYIFEKTRDGKNVKNTFEWYEKNIYMREKNLEKVVFGLEEVWKELLDNNGMISVTDTKSLPK